MTDIRPVCDGFDVSTPVGVLHFASEPTADDVAALVASLSAPAAVEPSVSVIAEDGEVV